MNPQLRHEAKKAIVNYLFDAMRPHQADPSSGMIAIVHTLAEVQLRNIDDILTKAIEKINKKDPT